MAYNTCYISGGRGAKSKIERKIAFRNAFQLKELNYYRKSGTLCQ